MSNRLFPLCEFLIWKNNTESSCLLSDWFSIWIHFFTGKSVLTSCLTDRILCSYVLWSPCLWTALSLISVYYLLSFLVSPAQHYTPNDFLLFRQTQSPFFWYFHHQESRDTDMVLSCWGAALGCYLDADSNLTASFCTSHPSYLLLLLRSQAEPCGWKRRAGLHTQAAGRGFPVPSHNSKESLAWHHQLHEHNL